LSQALTIITKGKSSANRFQAWQVDHERARQFSRQIRTKQEQISCGTHKNTQKLTEKMKGFLEELI